MEAPTVMIVKTGEVKEVLAIDFQAKEVAFYTESFNWEYASFDEVVLIKDIDLEKLLNTEEKKAVLKEKGLLVEG